MKPHFGWKISFDLSARVFGPSVPKAGNVIIKNTTNMKLTKLNKAENSEAAVPFPDHTEMKNLLMRYLLKKTVDCCSVQDSINVEYFTSS